MSSPSADEREWLEADGLGGFASGTVSGIRTRRYHGLLLVASTPPTGRLMLVNGYEAWVDSAAGRTFLSSQRYGGGAVYPDGAQRIVAFEHRPWPRWRYELPGGLVVEHELFVPHGRAAVCLRWRLVGRRAPATLSVRPLLSGRDYHALHRENPAFDFAPESSPGRVVWRPYPGVPGVVSTGNGAYGHEPEWYRNFSYLRERERGLDDGEDLASPGVLRFDLDVGPAEWLLSAEGFGEAPEPGGYARLRGAETRRRSRFASDLDLAADAYLVRRGGGLSLLAGYPWFTDWGRDACVAVRGLLIATGRLRAACEVLLTWAGAAAGGMLPNRFPDAGAAPEYNSVDASLWFVIAAAEMLGAVREGRAPCRRRDADRLGEAITAIVSAYAAGARFGIHGDDDGLLAAGAPGVALTWMDARVAGRPVTPRTGKPVEVEALWLNALHVAGALDGRWKSLFERGLASFGDRFWNPERGYLNDVVDVDHRSGTADPTLRPNQILAVGGLPLVLVAPVRAASVLAAIEHDLLTPAGLRTLAPGEPGYASCYEGGPERRDAAYHQGTVWPWLLGPFVEAWVRAHGGTEAARESARKRFLAPLLAGLAAVGLGHLPEIADAEAPHAWRGCPFQAWSLAEALRLDRSVLAGHTGVGRAR